jgi:DNA-binding HxlR family transcriptional regulator
MRTPAPGKPARGSRTGRPIMALLDLLGRRWILRILWELRAEALGFRDLQARCEGMSPSVLSQRLRDLQEARIAAQDEAGAYSLTAGGKSLIDALLPLHAWAERWSAPAGISFPPADDPPPNRRPVRRSRER